MKKKKRGRQMPKSSFTRAGRLGLARKWIASYEGRNIIKGYAKWFKVDKICAIIELRMLGIEISPEREKQVRDAIESLSRERQRTKETRAEELESSFKIGDENVWGFEMIIGTTGGGAPYGIPFEDSNENDEDIDLPF
jgi:hypothetical protein